MYSTQKRNALLFQTSVIPSPRPPPLTINIIADSKYRRDMEFLYIAARLFQGRSLSRPWLLNKLVSQFGVMAYSPHFAKS